MSHVPGGFGRVWGPTYLLTSKTWNPEESDLCGLKHGETYAQKGGSTSANHPNCKAQTYCGYGLPRVKVDSLYVRKGDD